jgi:poly-gamma-glutamate synthesis protein (capsule biosynthesis protein)
MPRRAALTFALLTSAACRGERRPDAATVDAGRDAVTPADVAPDGSAPDAMAVVDAGPPPRRVVVTLTGDVMLHRSVLDSFEDHATQGGLAWALNWLSPLVTRREVALTFLDSPLTDAYRPPFAGVPPGLGVPRAVARSVARDLGRVGLDGVCLATHHAYDQMGDGLGETRELLRGANLGVAGMGASEEEAWQPWVTERDGVRVAFLCFTQRVQMAMGRNAGHFTVAQALDGTRATQALTAARSLADVVVVGIQWNRAPFRPLAEEQRTLARELVAAGADVVVGSGMVAPGAVEKLTSPRGDALLVWSIGSLLSGYGAAWRGVRNPPPAGMDRLMWDATTRDVVLLRAQFDASDPAHLSLVTLTANALWMQRSEGVRLMPLREVIDIDVRESRARAVAAAVGPEVRVRQ